VDRKDAASGPKGPLKPPAVIPDSTPSIPCRGVPGRCAVVAELSAALNDLALALELLDAARWGLAA
jgi:hypothetical protein